MENQDSALAALSDELVRAVEAAGRLIVTVAARKRLNATGILWERGIVVTADHVVERDEDIKVILPNGQEETATLAGRDGTTDIAVLKISPMDGPVAEPEEQVSAGQLVLALGRPDRGGLSASFGAISTVGPEWRTWAGGRIDKMVRPEINLYPGFSGGPLVNAQGKVLGMNTSGLGGRGALTVPASTIARVARQLLENGSVERGYLGVRLQSVSLQPDVVRSLELQKDAGLLVIEVESEGPAERGGLLVGDVVVSIDGKQLSDPHATESVLDPGSAGKAVSLQVVRGGALAAITVTVGARRANREERHHHHGHHGHRRGKQHFG